MQKFVFVRKYRIIEVLEWLKAHNLLYNDISINYPLLNTWKDKFIPQEITDHLVLCDPDSQEREGYAASLRDDNFENDLDVAIAETKIEADQLHSGCVYSDIDDGRQNPILKLLSAIDNIKSGTTPIQNNAIPVITFLSQGRLIPLNDWENPSYFPVAFSTLFPFGNGRHLENREQPISIKAWAKWTLQHHSHW